MDLTKYASGPFVLFGTMSIVYDGRACSTIGPSNFLLIRKDDGSISVHAGDLNIPRNYMSSGATLTITNNVMVFVKKREKLIITILSDLQVMIPSDWSTEKLKISKTEKELCHKLIANPTYYFKTSFKDCFPEFVTDYGPVDIAFVEELSINDTLHIVEVKRKRITINDCHQLLKYHDSLKAKGHTIKNYIAAPDIAVMLLNFANNELSRTFSLILIK